MLVFVLALTAVVASWVAWRVKNRALLQISQNIPGPATVPGLGNALRFMVPSERIADVIGDMMQQYGDIFRFWLGPDLNVIVSDPEDVKNLISNNKTSTKGPQYKYMADYCGQGILTGSGPAWRKRRKVVMPSYGRRAVENYEVVFNQEADHTLARLSKVPVGETFDIYNDMVRCTTYTVCQTLMGLTREQTLNLPHLEAVFNESHEMLVFVLALTAVVASWVAWRVKNRALLQISQNIPGPATVPGLGNALRFMVPSERIADVIGDMMQEYGDIFRFWLGPDLNVIVSDPEDVKNLISNNKTSTKGPQYKYMADYCGQGILTGSGPAWRKRRKVVMPSYGRRAVENYEVVFNQEADHTLARLSKVPVGETFDIYNDMVRCTTYTVCQTLMGLTREQTLNLPHLEAVFNESHDLYLRIFKRMTKWYLQIDLFFYFTKFYQQEKEFIKKMLELGDVIVRHRLKTLETMDNDKKNELLSSENDEKSNIELSVVDRLVLSHQIPEYDEILKELFTVLSSSQDPSAKIASYLLQMMAYHPDCQEKLYAEIQNVLDDNEKDVTDEHIKEMTYLDMVFKEVLRLFPIGVMLQRTVTEDIKLRDVTLPAGCSLVVPIYHMQRDKRFWENPNAFDPERFAPGKPIPDAFLPFSYGPMDCIGRYFGTKLVKTVSVKVLRKFRLTSPETYEDMRLVLAVSVVSINGYPVQLHPRNVKAN